MLKIPKNALRYEKLLREEDMMQQDPNTVAADPNMQQQDPNVDPNADPNMQQDPNALAQPSGLESAQTPEEAYEAGLQEIQNQIAMTGRKRYQRYKLNGGKDSWEVFRKNLEDTLKQELEDDCKDMFGYNPGKTTEKDLLIMIKNGIEQLNATMQQGMAAEQGDPNAQQAMQEDFNNFF